MHAKVRACVRCMSSDGSESGGRTQCSLVCVCCGLCGGAYASSTRTFRHKINRAWRAHDATGSGHTCAYNYAVARSHDADQPRRCRCRRRQCCCSQLGRKLGGRACALANQHEARSDQRYAASMMSHSRPATSARIIAVKSHISHSTVLQLQSRRASATIGDEL